METLIIICTIIAIVSGALSIMSGFEPEPCWITIIAIIIIYICEH